MSRFMQDGPYKLTLCLAHVFLRLSPPEMLTHDFRHSFLIFCKFVKNKIFLLQYSKDSCKQFKWSMQDLKMFLSKVLNILPNTLYIKLSRLFREVTFNSKAFKLYITNETQKLFTSDTIKNSLAFEILQYNELNAR